MQTRTLSMGKGTWKVRVRVCLGFGGSETHMGWRQGSSTLNRLQAVIKLILTVTTCVVTVWTTWYVHWHTRSSWTYTIHHCLSSCDCRSAVVGRHIGTWLHCVWKKVRGRRGVTHLGGRWWGHALSPSERPGTLLTCQVVTIICRLFGWWRGMAWLLL